LPCQVDGFMNYGAVQRLQLLQQFCSAVVGVNICHKEPDKLIVVPCCLSRNYLPGGIIKFHQSRSAGIHQH